MYRKMLGLLCVLCVGSVVLAESAYKITLRVFPDVGKNVEVTSSHRQDVDQKLRDADGKVVGTKAFTERTKEEYKLTVLEKGDKRPRKFRREYSKAEAGDATSMKGQPY